MLHHEEEGHRLPYPLNDYLDIKEARLLALLGLDLPITTTDIIEVIPHLILHLIQDPGMVKEVVVEEDPNQLSV